MKTFVATLVALALLAAALPAPAVAGGGSSVNAALALGSFAVFNQMLAGVGLFGPVRWGYPAPVYYSAYYPAYYYAAPAPAYYPPPAPIYYTARPVGPPPPARAPAISREVVYPNGKYVLQGDGITVAYQWTWVPNAAAAAPSPQFAPPQFASPQAR